MITIEGLNKTFVSDKNKVQALKNINLEIKTGEIFGVIGYSGSGKSTLLRCINRLEEPDEGKIKVGDDDILSLSEKQLSIKRRKIGIIFQHFNLLKNDTVYKNVARPLLYSGMKKNDVKKRVTELLELVGLSDKVKSYPSQLSGGQKQRVAIARALAEEPELLLCDEATSALDPDTTKSIVELLKELNKKLNLTMIVVTHQMEVVRDLCDRVAVLSEGEIVDIGDTLTVFSKSDNRITSQFANSLFQTEEISRVLKNEKVRQIIDNNGKVYRLLFLGKCANEALISDVSRKFTVDTNIIFGNIVLFKEEPVGNLYVAIQGTDPEVREAVNYIVGKEVIVNAISE